MGLDCLILLFFASKQISSELIGCFPFQNAIALLCHFVADMKNYIGTIFKDFGTHLGTMLFFWPAILPYCNYSRGCGTTICSHIVISNV